MKPLSTILCLSMWGAMSLSYAQKLDVFAGASSSHFLGDLGGKAVIGTNDLQDLDLPSTRYGLTLGTRLRLNKTFALRANLWYARLAASDALTINKDRQVRNLSFFTRIWEADAVAEINLIHSRDRRKALYVFGGVGYFNFNPKTKYNGTTYALHDIGTEGQNLGIGKTPYALSALCFPMGMGVKVNLSTRAYLTFEVNGRKTTTDYIDDVSTTYADPYLMLAQQGQLAVDLSNRSGQVVEAGQQRGDSKNNDSYFFFSVAYNHTIGANNHLEGLFKRKHLGPDRCFSF